MGDFSDLWFIWVLGWSSLFCKVVPGFGVSSHDCKSQRHGSNSRLFPQNASLSSEVTEVQGCGPKLIQTWATTVLAGHFQLEKSLQWHWSGLKLSTPQKQHMKQQRPQRDVRLCSGEMPAALPQPSGKTCGHLYMSQNHSQAHMQDTQSHDCSLRREMITRHLTWTKIFLLLILNLPSPSSSEQFAAFAFILKGSDPSLLGGRRPLGFTSLCNVLKLLVLCFKAWLDLRACRSISLLAV